MIRARVKEESKNRAECMRTRNIMPETRACLRVRTQRQRVQEACALLLILPLTVMSVRTLPIRCTTYQVHLEDVCWLIVGVNCWVV